MNQTRSHEHFLLEGGGLVPSPDRLRKVLVVGAGVAGLQTARQMLRLGAQVLVLEANDDIGGVWCRNYHGFGLQVPWRMYQFPEFPWPKDLQPSSEYPTGREVQEYVRAYCQEYDLKRYIRFNCKLLRLRWCPNSRQWDALYCDTNQEKFFKVTVDYAVVCAGIYSQPYIPDYEGTDSYAGIQLHAKDFVDLSLARGRRVVIVGAGKTALDCVSSIVATNTATSVTLLYRQAHWPLPRRMLGTSVRRLLFNRAMSGMMPPYYTAGAAAHVTSKAMAPVKKLFWRGMEAVISRKFRITEQMRPRVHLPADLFYGGQILDNSMDKLIRNESLVTIKGEINRFVRNGVILQDGNFVAADLVLYCTGYLKTYDYLEGDMRSRLDLQKDGLYLYRNCLPYAVPHLAFIGSEVSTYNNILTHGLQALWLAQVLSGRVQLPAPVAIAEDVRAQQRWRRAIMPAQRSRGSVLMLYMMQYHDQLMADMGQPTRRKGLNILAECFGAYTAFDYRTLLVEDKTAIANARQRVEEQLTAAGAPPAAPAAAGRSGPSGTAGAAAAAAAAGAGGGGGCSGRGASGRVRNSPNGVGNGLSGGAGGGGAAAAANLTSTRDGRLQGHIIDDRLGNSSRGGTSVSARSVLHDNDDSYGGGRSGGLPYHPVLVPSGVATAGCPGSSRTSASIAEGSSYRISETDVETPADPAQTASTGTLSPTPYLRFCRPPSSTADGAPVWAVNERQRQAARAIGARVSADIAAMPPRSRRAAGAAGGGGASANSVVIGGSASGSFRVASASAATAAAAAASFSSQGWSAAVAAGAAPHSGPVRGGGSGAAAAAAVPSRRMPSPLPSHPQSVQGCSNGLVWPAGKPPMAGAAAAARTALMPPAPTHSVPPAVNFFASSVGAGAVVQVGSRSFTTTRGSSSDAAGGGIMCTTAAALAPSSPSRLSRHTGPSSPLPQRSRQTQAPPPQQQPQPQDGTVQHVHWSLGSEDGFMVPCGGGNDGNGGVRQAAMRALAKSASECHLAPHLKAAPHRTFCANAVGGHRGGVGVRSSDNNGCCGQHCPCCTAGCGAGTVAIPVAADLAPVAGRSAFACRCQPRPLTNPLYVRVPESGKDSVSDAAPFDDPDDGESPYDGCDAVLAAQDCCLGLRDTGRADIEGLCDAGYEGQGQRDRGGGDGGVVLRPATAAAARGDGAGAAAGNRGSGSASCANSPGSERGVRTKAPHSHTPAAAADTAAATEPISPMPNRAVATSVTVPAAAGPGASVHGLGQRVRTQRSQRDFRGAACGGVASSSDRSHRLSSDSRSRSSDSRSRSSGSRSRSSGESNASSSVHSGHTAEGANTNGVCGGGGGSSSGGGDGGCMSLESPPMRSQQKDQQQVPCPSVDGTLTAAAATVAAVATAAAAAPGVAAAKDSFAHVSQHGREKNPGQEWVQDRDRDSPPPPPLPPPLPPQPPRPLPLNMAAAAAGESPWRTHMMQHVQTVTPFGSVLLEQTVGSPGSAASLSHWTSGALATGRPPAVRRPSLEALRPPPLSRLPETEESDDAGGGGSGIVVGDSTAVKDRPSAGGAAGSGPRRVAAAAAAAAAVAASLQRVGSNGAGSGGAGSLGSRDWRRLAVGLLSADGGPAGSAVGAADSGSWQQLFPGAFSTGSSGVLPQSSISFGAGLMAASCPSVKMGPAAVVESMPRQPSPSPLSNSNAHHIFNARHACGERDPSCSLGNWVGQVTAALSSSAGETCPELTVVPPVVWSYYCDLVAGCGSGVAAPAGGGSGGADTEGPRLVPAPPLSQGPEASLAETSPFSSSKASRFSSSKAYLCQ